MYLTTDKKKEIFDEDIETIIDELSVKAPSVWELESLQTTAGTGVIPTATVRLSKMDGQVIQDAATGDGPVDAIYSAIQRITGLHAKLIDYQIRAITKGKDAQGEVRIEIEIDGVRLNGRGVSTDIIEASAKAYLAAINRYLARTTRK